MSLPTFPSICPPLTINESLNMILASIAMEELGLSHIINAEGEKLQYVLGTLEGSPHKKASVEEVLAVNKSIKSLLDSIMQNQVILKGKMECAVDALERNGCGITGPTGPAGPTGPIGPAGIPDQPGPAGSCSAVSFSGCSRQSWAAGTPLIWSHSECSKCRSLYLSSDCKKIVLGERRCYVVSFSIDLRVSKWDDNGISVGVQTQDSDNKRSRFICHAPINEDGVPVTVSAGGIFISTHDCSRSTELMLTLLSPASVKVNQASICVMEI